MADMITFPNTVEEFMEQYKITDTEQIYTNGAELIPIFRMKQWFDHKLERKKGKWIRITQGAMPEQYICPFCHRIIETYSVEELLSIRYPYCHCGADMRGEEDV